MDTQCIQCGNQSTLVRSYTVCGQCGEGFMYPYSITKDLVYTGCCDAYRDANLPEDQHFEPEK
jgi:hypothetical protein